MQGKARQVNEIPGKARQGDLRQASQARHGHFTPGNARQFDAWQSQAKHSQEWEHKAIPGKAISGK
ncbi:hypothetical protein P7K49_007517, partial [Saguinus oedipus]